MSKKSIFNTSADLNFSDIEPSLYLNFVASQKVPPFINVTRNSQTTYVDKFGILRTADINQPVFEWDPITGKCLGARIWGPVTNLLVRTQEFETASWTKNNSSVTSNTTIAPDGTTTADSLIEDTTTATHLTFQDYTGSAIVQYTESVFVKANTRSRVRLRLGDGGANGVVATFNLSTGTVTATANIGTGSGVSASIAAYANGWYRISVTGIPATTGTTVRSHVYLVNDAGTTSYTGDGTSGIYLWGAQLSTGSVAAPYVPTTSSSVTAAADVWTITGAAAAGIINPAEFTVFLRGRRGYAGAFTNFDNFLVLSDGTASNVSAIYANPGGSTIVNYQIFSAGTGQTDYVSVSVPTTNTFTAIQALSTNDSQFVVNGTFTTQDTTVNMPVGLNKISIGSDRVGSLQGNYYIEQLAIWPKRLPNSTLVSMTS